MPVAEHLGVGVEAYITVVSDHEIDDFVALLEWLQAERDLRGAVQPVRATPVDGQLSGGALEAIAVSLGSSGVGVALARTLTAWIKNQRTDVRLTVRSGEHSVEVEAHGTDIATLLKEVLPSEDA